MNYIFNGAITDSVWQEGLERLLRYRLTGMFPAAMSAHSFDDIGSDSFPPKFPSGQALRTVHSPCRNPHRLQRDFLLYQAGYPPRRVRVSNSNGPLGNVAVIRRPPSNNQPIAGPCLIWRGSLSGSTDGKDGGYAQYNGKLLHRFLYEESRCVRVADEEKVLHLCHRRACIQPSHLYLGNDADNAEDRARRFRQPFLPSIPPGDAPLEERLRAALLSDLSRVKARFSRTETEHSRAWDAAYHTIQEIPAFEPPGDPLFLMHECRPGPWAGAVHICLICNMTPCQIENLPLLANLLAWDSVFPQRWWGFEESTKPVFVWLRRRDPKE